MPCRNNGGVGTSRVIFGDEVYKNCLGIKDYIWKV